jgi:ornithine carbamoyltransferase
VIRSFLEANDLTADELIEVLDRSEVVDPPKVMAGSGMAILFEKPSLRTRHSTEMAVVQLGGHPITVRNDEVGPGTREPIGDMAHVLSRYHAALGARVYVHSTVEELAAAATVPVVNLLSDLAHPTQALADVLTMRQQFGRVKDLSVAYVGDYNNVARSLSLAVSALGGEMKLGCPSEYGPDSAEVEAIGSPMVTQAPEEAVKGADVVYTDVWTSMGQETEAADRRAAFAGFTVDDRLMALASPEAVFLHCLPAHRGEEVSGSVADGPQSLIITQAENRMHVARGLLWWLLEQT